jgi:hypothetical protein
VVLGPTPSLSTRDRAVNNLYGARKRVLSSQVTCSGYETVSTLDGSFTTMQMRCDEMDAMRRQRGQRGQCRRMGTGTWQKAGDSSSKQRGSNSDDVPIAERFQMPGSGVGAFSPNIEILERRQ